MCIASERAGIKATSYDTARENICSREGGSWGERETSAFIIYDAVARG